MKSKRKLIGILTFGILFPALPAGPGQAADPEIRVAGCKDSTPEAGERSGLINGPAGAEHTANS